MSRRIAAWAGVLMLAGGLGGCSGQPDAPPHRVTINGRSWRVELATTPEQRYKGLGGRSELADDAGMLFIFPFPEVQDFCMRDCLIPLDIAFISADLRVVRMHTMAVEPKRYGEKTYSSGAPAQFALELNAGALQRAGVKVGDRVQFSSDIPIPR